MSKPVIQVRGISKSYKISHEMKANVGDVTMRDTIVRTLKKPVELLTGHVMKKEKFWALHDVSFDVQPGEVVGIIGKNGSGKSTLLKIMSRITEPTHGEIIMNGKVASLLEVGTGFHPELTGRENIYFNGSILGMKKKEIEAKFDEIVAFSEVEKFLDTPVKFYSSGMYVRLAFAVAAHLEPDILIVDEVLAVGDAAFQKKCLGKMKDVAGQGRTVLFVSHNMPSVKSLCNKVIWLESGLIHNIGDIDKVTDGYILQAVAKNSNLAKSTRSGNLSLEAKIIKVDVSNVGVYEGIIDSTKPMQIRFEIEAKSDLSDYVDVHCVVNSDGNRALRFMTEYTKKTIRLTKGKNLITCTIEPSRLTGGVYSIDCSILFPGRESIGHIDEVIDAKIFTVKDLPSPSHQEYLTQRDAAYYVDHKWSQS